MMPLPASDIASTPMADLLHMSEAGQHACWERLSCSTTSRHGNSGSACGVVLLDLKIDPHTNSWL
jgi:hypothetical protein